MAAGAVAPLAEMCRLARRSCTDHAGGALAVDVLMVDFEGNEVVARA